MRVAPPRRRSRSRPMHCARITALAIPLTTQIQGRLVTLAQTHDAAVVCLTEKTEDTASLGSLVSLRAQALRRRCDPLRARTSPASTSVLALAPTSATDLSTDGARTAAP